MNNVGDLPSEGVESTVDSSNNNKHQPFLPILNTAAHSSITNLATLTCVATLVGSLLT